MISRLFLCLSKVKQLSRVFVVPEAVSLDRRRDFVVEFGASSLQARRLSTGMAALQASEADAPDDAVLDAWRKELRTAPTHNGKNGELSFLLLKNILYWGSVALSLYLIFTVFSFF